MNKIEVNTILNHYKNEFEAHLLGFNKEDILISLKRLLKSLGLTKDVYIIENMAIAEKKGMSYIEKEMYGLIFETFAKYERYVNYNLCEIEEVYYDLQYKMSDEENRCHIARVKNIRESQRV